jgi:hypothetical protein
VRLRMLQEGFTLGVDFAASTSLGLRIRTILLAPQPIPWWKSFSRMTAGLALVSIFCILAPGMTVSMGFAEPIAHQILSYHPESTVAVHARDARHLLKQVSRHPETPDSLNTLRTRPYVAETPAYTMTSNSGARPGAERAEVESPAWREAPPSIQYPLISSVVRSTLGEIAARGTRGGHDHDKDDH